MRALGRWNDSPGTGQPPSRLAQPRVPAHKPDPRSRYRHVSVAAYGASAPAFLTPAAVYLERRGVWPATRVAELPPAVRWVPARLAPVAIRESLAANLADPDAVAGLLMYVYRTRAGELAAAKFEAISATGHRLTGCDGAAWKRNYGQRDGGLFVALDIDVGDWHLTEGEADALAVASTLERGRVVCASGASGWQLATCRDAQGQRIVLHPDRNLAGVDALSRLLATLTGAGLAATVALCCLAGDPAADVAATRMNEGPSPQHPPETRP